MTITSTNPISTRPFSALKRLSLCAVFATLAGCQLLPSPPPEPTAVPKKPSSSKDASTPDGIKITPYDRDEIKREPLQVVLPKQQAQQQKFDDGQQLPAFKQLIQQTQHAFARGNWNEAENFAMQAQRLAPQSAETYLYLALVANHKQQPANAESLARRGLSYAQSNAMKKQLWQAVLKAAQQQNNARSIQEAQLKLKAL